MTHKLRSWLIIFGTAAFYGLVCRLLFAWGPLQGWLQIVSASFLYSMPLSLGALVCFLGYKLDQPGRFWALGAPMITMLLLLCGSLLFQLEALFCVLLAAPIVSPFALLGGWLMSVILRRFDGGRLQITVWVLLPYLVSPVEQMWQRPHETRVMRDSIVIHAPAGRVWDHIKTVEAIHPGELDWRWIYTLGFPRPIAATLDHEGVGGRRLATFEREVSFYEVVTHWEPHQNCRSPSRPILNSSRAMPLTSTSSWAGASMTSWTALMKSRRGMKIHACCIFGAPTACPQCSTATPAGGVSGSCTKSKAPSWG
ncbi:MAG TPA: hypothetical protein PK490_07540 [Prosthecobacter sp.]|nr:hypothetical protein [Prosthecobacter sp.]HRK14127.1 hypothetical protein [Prosthecobacter sp.]